MVKAKLEQIKKLEDLIPEIKEVLTDLEKEFETFEKTALIKDKTDPKKFEDFLYTLANFVLYENLSGSASADIMEFTEIVYNWNRATRARSEIIITLTLLINRILEMRTLLIEQTDLLKKVEYNIRIFRDWLPPAFSVSKEYLEQLLTTNKECKKLPINQ